MNIAPIMFHLNLIYERAHIYNTIRNKVLNIINETHMIALRDIEIDQKIEQFLGLSIANQERSHDDVIVDLDIYGVGLNTYVDCDDLLAKPVLLRYRGENVNFDWLFKCLYVFAPTRVEHCISTRVFIESDFIPYFILNKMTARNIALLAHQRYGPARVRLVAAYKKEMDEFFHCDDVIDVILEYIYPRHSTIKF